MRGAAACSAAPFAMIKIMSDRVTLRGQATLSFILLVSGLILEIAIAGTFVTYVLSTASLGERLYARAFTAAYSGIRDAQMRIVRNKGYSGAYTFMSDADEAFITVAGAPVGSGYQYTATSTGAAGSRRRTLVAIIVVDQVSGLVELRSLDEVAAQ